MLLAEGAARSHAVDALNDAISLFAGAPGRRSVRSREQVARRARLRLAGRPHDGAEPRPRSRFGLTEREADVLRLLAEARTNREIGETLFISPKTVSVHVTSIMRKLGVKKASRRCPACRQDVASGPDALATPPTAGAEPRRPRLHTHRTLRRPCPIIAVQRRRRASATAHGRAIPKFAGCAGTEPTPASPTTIASRCSSASTTPRGQQRPVGLGKPATTSGTRRGGLDR